MKIIKAMPTIIGILRTLSEDIVADITSHELRTWFWDFRFGGRVKLPPVADLIA